jgi:hypothetical protein
MDLTGMLQAAAGSAGGGILVQEVFSTTLYTGNGSTQTITNDIDLAGEGGLVWTKGRSVAESHNLVDTIRGVDNNLRSNSTDAQFNLGAGTSVTGFNNNGYSIGTFSEVNQNTKTYASWTFRKAPKFFDIVTYTGTGSNRTVAHNLGSVPGCFIVKRTSASEGWQVYHRSTGATKHFELNNMNAVQTSSTRWNNTTPTDTVFTVGTHASVNASGSTYVAYLWAHDDGGFGSDENVVSCGTYVGNGSATGPTVTLGYEPQWLMVKAVENTFTATDDWIILDAYRDVSNPRNAFLRADTSDTEATGNDVDFNATSFQLKTTSASVNKNAINYIYIAIRADM